MSNSTIPSMAKAIPQLVTANFHCFVQMLKITHTDKYGKHSLILVEHLVLYIIAVSYAYNIILFSRIGHDFSFDDDMASLGCEVHSFDPRYDILQSVLQCYCKIPRHANP